jgi:hypothetical protein
VNGHVEARDSKTKGRRYRVLVFVDDALWRATRNQSALKSRRKSSYTGGERCRSVMAWSPPDSTSPCGSTTAMEPLIAR